MSKARSTISALMLLLLTGAGCLNFGSKNAPAAATGGMWVTENNGSSWMEKSVLPTATGTSSINGLDILAFEQDPSDASTLYIGSKTSGMFYSLDGGESWLRPEDKMASSGSVLAVEVDPKNICTYYVLKSDRLLKTSTCGREFNDEAYVQTKTDESLTALAIDWYDPQNIYLGTTDGDVLRSTDGGATWAATVRPKNRITDIEVSNADSRTILVGTYSNGVYRTTDGGANWVQLKDELKDYKKASSVYDFEQTGDGSRILMRSGYGLLSSDDAGASWKSISLVTSSGDVYVRAAAISPTNKDIMYYATSTTFYTSTSGGNAWSTATLPSSRSAAVIHVDDGNEDRVFLGVLSLDK